MQKYLKIIFFPRGQNIAQHVNKIYKYFILMGHFVQPKLTNIIIYHFKQQYNTRTIKLCIYM